MFEEAYTVCGRNMLCLQNDASESALKDSYGGGSKKSPPTLQKMDPGAFSVR